MMMTIIIFIKFITIITNKIHNVSKLLNSPEKQNTE